MRKCKRVRLLQIYNIPVDILRHICAGFGEGRRSIIPLSVLDSNPAKSSHPRIKSIYCQDAHSAREHTPRECARGKRRAHNTYPSARAYNIQTLLINKKHVEDGRERLAGSGVHLIYFSLCIRISAMRW